MAGEAFQRPLRARAFVTMHPTPWAAKQLHDAKRGSAGADGDFATRFSNANLDGRNASVGADDGHGSKHRIGVGSVDGATCHGSGIRVWTSAKEALAHGSLGADDADFRWDARAQDRWFRGCRSPDDEDLERDRIAICARLQGCWRFGVMLADGYWVSREIIGKHPCSSRKAASDRLFIRTDRSRAGHEQQRPTGLAASDLLEPAGSEVEDRGKQDKGSVLRPCISLCLHILFWRDWRYAPRDSGGRNGASQPFLARDRETPGLSDA